MVEFARRLFAPFALGVALSSTGCGAALSEAFTPPESGGAPWTSVASKHFVLETDLPAEDARAASAEFERIYSMFEDVAFPYVEKPRLRTTVVLFRREAEYVTIAPRSSAGYFLREPSEDDYGEPMAVFYGDFTIATRATFQHELTHRFMDFYFPRAPVWLNEGMADYYSTMDIEDGKIILGRTQPNALFRAGLSWAFESTPIWPVIAYVPTGSARSVAELRGMSRDDFYAARSQAESENERRRLEMLQTANYVSAWALVHLMKNGPDQYRSRFGSFLEKLGGNTPPEEAWQSAFADIDQDALQKDYQAWLAPLDRIVLRTPYAASAAAAPTERAMDPYFVHVLWARVRPWKDDAHRSRARADLTEAIRLDPRRTEARVLLARLDQVEGRIDEAENGLKAALTAAPGDPAATFALFRLYVRRGMAARADELLPKVLATATSVSVQNGAARYLAMRDRADEGLPLALRAVRADPSCWQCFDTLAILLMKKGALVKAVEAQSIAVNLVPEGYTRDAPTIRLRKYEEALKRARQGSAPQGEGSSPSAQPSTPAAAAPGASISTPTPAGVELDRRAASIALANAASSAKACHKHGDSGTGAVRVVFEPSGRVSEAVVQGPPLAGTPTGDCVAAVFRAVSIPPFSGPAVKVTKSFSISSVQ